MLIIVCTYFRQLIEITEQSVDYKCSLSSILRIEMKHRVRMVFAFVKCSQPLVRDLTEQTNVYMGEWFGAFFEADEVMLYESIGRKVKAYHHWLTLEIKPDTTDYPQEHMRAQASPIGASFQEQTKPQ